MGSSPSYLGTFADQIAENFGAIKHAEFQSPSHRGSLSEKAAISS
jgi:hypothetical protein